MKRLLTVLLAAMMLSVCLHALADSEFLEEIGLALDYDEVQAKTLNYAMLSNEGIATHEPYLAIVDITYCNCSKEVVDEHLKKLEEAETEEEFNQLLTTIRSKMGVIGCFFVTNAKTPKEAGLKDPLPENVVLTQFSTLGNYSYYFLTYPVEDLLDRFGLAEGSDDRAKVLSDIRMVQSEVLGLLQATELSEPVDEAKTFVGRVLSFESVDLDGNPVRSSDLFRENKITMVNLWGTWCVNCMNEMDKLAEIDKRIREKGCGIVGVEFENEPIEAVADLARKVFQENGITYPNVILPENDPVFSDIRRYPTTLFVDSEGKILTYPITGAAVDDYEPTLDKLLAGEAVETAPETGAAENDSGEYRVIVYDTDGQPVKGAIVQLCDETTCSFQKTKADGIATFKVDEPKVYDVHIEKAPAGYENDSEVFKTLDTYCDINIFLKKAE